MWKKFISTSISCIMVLTAFIGTTSQRTVYAQSNTVSTDSNVTIERFAGADRYSTAAEICKKGWNDKSEYAVLANGENFPDALSAAPLAKKYNAPILLTSKDALNDKTKSELQRLNVKQVLTVGGTGVISENVESTLNSMNISVKRFYGKDRYETSIKVAEEVGLNDNGVFVTNGENFPDALSVAPIAAQKGMPIILVPKDNLTESTDKYVSSNSITKSYVIGNSNSVSESIVSKFKNTERIYGASRYATNAAIIEKFENDLDFRNICVANGENFPDGLSGSVLAASGKEPILLVTEQVDESTKVLVNKKSSLLKKVRVLGGSAVVSDSITERIRTNFQNDNIPVDWKLLYREKLKETLPEYGDLVALIDINLDGTPELLIGYQVGSGSFSEAYCAYTIKNGSLVSILNKGSNSSYDIEDIDSSKLYYNSSTNKYQIVSESYVQNGAFYRSYSTYIYNLNNDILSQTGVIGRIEDEQTRGNIKYTYIVSDEKTNETEYTQAKANLYNGWKEVKGFGVALKQVTSSINDINNFLDSYTSSINIDESYVPKSDTNANSKFSYKDNKDLFSIIQQNVRLDGNYYSLVKNKEKLIIKGYEYKPGELSLYIDSNQNIIESKSVLYNLERLRFYTHMQQWDTFTIKNIDQRQSDLNEIVKSVDNKIAQDGFVDIALKTYSRVSLEALKDVKATMFTHPKNLSVKIIKYLGEKVGDPNIENIIGYALSNLRETYKTEDQQMFIIDSMLSHPNEIEALANFCLSSYYYDQVRNNILNFDSSNSESIKQLIENYDNANKYYGVAIKFAEGSGVFKALDILSFDTWKDQFLNNWADATISSTITVTEKVKGYEWVSKFLKYTVYPLKWYDAIRCQGELYKIYKGYDGMIFNSAYNKMYDIERCGVKMKN